MKKNSLHSFRYAHCAYEFSLQQEYDSCLFRKFDRRFSSWIVIILHLHCCRRCTFLLVLSTFYLRILYSSFVSFLPQDDTLELPVNDEIRWAHGPFGRNTFKSLFGNSSRTFSARSTRANSITTAREDSSDDSIPSKSHC